MNNDVDNYAKQKKLTDICDDVIYKLKEALTFLKSSSRWGVVDVLGGETFSTLMKHRNLSKAQRLIYQAETELNNLYNMLDDKERMIVIGDVDIGGLLTIADFVWDGFISDILVQRKISSITQKVYQAIREIEEMRERIIQTYS